FLLNLGVGALSLITARTILADGGGFETVVLVLAIGACFIVLGAMLLPAKTDPAATPATAPAE
ncbi:MAG: MFS transporter, partial [Rhodospirillaceae bacterium]|nr:MFS transporter [Rhodospirillaceae bacterium]